MQNSLCSMSYNDAKLFVDTRNNINAIFDMDYSNAIKCLCDDPVKLSNIIEYRKLQGQSLCDWFKSRGVTSIDAVMSSGESTVPRVLSNEIDYKGIGLDWLKLWRRLLYWLGL